MKNIIIASLMATTAFVGTASASASTCSDRFENVSRFNPTTLSDYQRCIIDEVWTDKDSGRIGNLVWVRAGDNVVSVTVDQLRKAGSEEAARELVITKVVKETIYETIDNTLKNIEQAKTDILNSLTDVESIKDISAKLDELKSFQKQQASLNDMLVKIEKEVRVIDYDVKLNSLENKLVDKHYDSSQLINGDTIFHIDGNGVDDNGEKDHIRIGVFSNGYVVGNYTYNDETEMFKSEDAKWVGIGNDWGLGEIRDLVREVVKVSYDRGYQDGYNDGYRDGYNKGFEDGKNSVNNS